LFRQKSTQLAAGGLWHEIITSGTAALAPAAGSTPGSGGGY
jgi:hypothetical protein